MTSFILYSKINSQRLNYIVEFVFSRVLGLPCEITNSKEYFIASKQFKINYSNEEIQESDLQIIPNSLLSETAIIEQDISIEIWQQLPCFFKTSQYEIPFDIFSASFFLISRYEEYYPYSLDLYQRYPEKSSLAFQHNFLNMPLVDYWIMALKKIILSKKSAISFPEKRMKFIPTYDIDIAYSYLSKGILRNIGGGFRDLIQGHVSLIKSRIEVLSGKQKDPFDSFDFLDQLHQQYHLKPIYFFLVSKGGPLDKNILPSKVLMKKLIHRIKSTYKVGIHPSFQSNDNRSILEHEISLLESNKSRQHYIRFQLPSTFRNLIEFGIQEDYSMGYGSINGFRASTCFDHQWFDLEKNEISSLRLFPFCYMECNSFYEQKMSAEQAFNEMLHYHQTVNQVGGNFISIWHNFSLGSEPMWKGWKEIYTSFIEKTHSSY